jgi:hypothetical protein
LRDSKNGDEKNRKNKDTSGGWAHVVPPENLTWQENEREASFRSAGNLMLQLWKVNHRNVKKNSGVVVPETSSGS